MNELQPQAVACSYFVGYQNMTNAELVDNINTIINEKLLSDSDIDSLNIAYKAFIHIQKPSQLRISILSSLIVSKLIEKQEAIEIIKVIDSVREKVNATCEGYGTFMEITGSAYSSLLADAQRHERQIDPHDKIEGNREVESDENGDDNYFRNMSNDPLSGILEDAMKHERKLQDPA